MKEMFKSLFLTYNQIVHYFSGKGIGKFRFIQHIHRMISSHGLFADVQGHKMFLDPRDNLSLFIHGVFEPLETEIVRKEIKEGDVVLDIGAHIGYYTLIFARLVGEKGHIFAFEPDPNNFHILKRNVEINGYQNITLVQAAVSDINGSINLYQSNHNSANNIIGYIPSDNRKSVKVKTIRLDDYFKNYNRKINFIKIDVEGSEGKVIKGMSLTLPIDKNVKIITEFYPQSLQESDTNPKEYLQMIAGLGYRFFYDINEEKKIVELTDISKLLEKYAPKLGEGGVLQTFYA